MVADPDATEALHAAELTFLQKQRDYQRAIDAAKFVYAQFFYDRKMALLQTRQDAEFARDDKLLQEREALALSGLAVEQAFLTSVTTALASYHAAQVEGGRSLQEGLAEGAAAQNAALAEAGVTYQHAQVDWQAAQGQANIEADFAGRGPIEALPVWVSGAGSIHLTTVIWPWTH